MMLYFIKNGVADNIKKKYKCNWIADEIGISSTYVSLILAGKKGCPKRIAYCFSKTLDINSEIEDFFEYKSKEDK